MPEDKLLTAEQMATLLQVHPATLWRWRAKGVGPAFIRMGDGNKGTIRYLPLRGICPKSEESD